jgi:ferredoxin
VLGRIDLGFHRHVRIRDAQACNGCKKCVRVCEPGALTYIYVPPARSGRDGQRIIEKE